MTDLVPSGQVDKVLGPHLQRIYKIRPTTPSDPGRMPDAVNLSAQARRMRIATEAIQAFGDVRQGKVAQIQQLLEQDCYKPSESDIADCMLKRAIERLV